MQPFTKLTGIAASLPLANVDTDKIIPARHLKTIKRTGLGVHLFETLRYHDDGSERPDFVLNLGLPTGATGGLDIGADASFGTTPNNQGGPALTLYDFGTETFRAVALNNGAFEVVTFP